MVTQNGNAAEGRTAVAGAPSPTGQPEFFDRQEGPFFRRLDWGAFWTTFLVSFGVYFHTLAPTVTLEDSGELAVASDYLGVPHPPGYPIWTLLTWLFQWIFHWVRYYGQPDSNYMLIIRSIKDLFDPSHQGHPNPAWSVGLTSAFFGALSTGLLALLVSRSGADILRTMKRETELIGLKGETILCWVAGVTGGLLYAFSSVLWSQCTIVEVYALNSFFMVLTVLLMYRWMCRPKEDSTLFITAFVFGLGLTNHQTLLFVVLALMAAMWFRDRPLFRDCLAGLFWLIAGILFWKAQEIGDGASPEAIRSKQSMFTVGLLFVFAPAGLFLIERKLMTEWRRFAIVVLLAGLGLSFYAYLPFASEQNPPMNWGYPRTLEGFWHAISRGQYEKIDPSANLAHAIANPGYFAQLLNAIVFDPKDYTSVVAQFSWGISLFVAVPFFFLGRIGRKVRQWIVVTLAAFISLTVIFIIFQYPKLDVQTLFIGRVQYIQAHAIFALWISYGLIFALAFIDTLFRGRKAATYTAAGFALLLPLYPVLQNVHDEQYIRIVGAVEQNGHDFGWQFGAWELEGSRAILSEIGEEEKAAFPNPDYPRPMDTNAVFFGGTDPGRFVPTYMIYSADYRSDVYLITQNALADNTYMNVMRDLYGDRIWIPSQQDSNFAFQKYVQDVQSGKIPAGADVSFEGGRVSVQGVQGVMMINGILARMIFEANKAKHAFYVEESYVIPWMYEYLEPHGLIMKINAEPLPGLSPEMVKNDHDFWTWYTKRLMSNPRFLRDVVARKTFSKLRSAIAGLFAWRRNYEEAEFAFRQAIDLYPLSPEANFRLADIYMQQFRFADAGVVIEQFLKEDPGNEKVGEFLTQIRDTEKADTRRRELEAALAKGADIKVALELADIYRRMNLGQLFQNLAMNIINQQNLPPEITLQVAQMFAEAKRLDLLSIALERYLERKPADARRWIDLAAVQANLTRTNECIQSLRKAVQIGGEPARDIVRKDRRFDAVRDVPEFSTLVPPLQPGTDLPMNLGFPGG
jgi:tetratricopeptide (TPR) repeat protein